MQRAGTVWRTSLEARPLRDETNRVRFCGLRPFSTDQRLGPRPASRPRRELCARCACALRACLAVFPCDTVKQPCAFCSSSCREAALRLHSSGALLQCRAFTAAARLYSAAARLSSSCTLRRLAGPRIGPVAQAARREARGSAPRRASASVDFRRQPEDRHCPAKRLRFFDPGPAGPRSTPGLPARNRANMRGPCAEAAPCARTAHKKPRQHARGYHPEGGPVRPTAAAPLCGSWALAVGPSRALARHSPSSRSQGEAKQRG